MLRWLRSGILPSVRTPGGHWRVAEEHLVGLEGPPASLGESVLVVDDREPHCRALEHVLRLLRPGLTVFSAQNGFEAGLLLSQQRPSLVFVDIEMPGINGIELIRRVRTLPGFEGTRFVVISGHLNAERHDELRDLGVPPDRVLPKPIVPKRLRWVLDQLGLAPVQA